ncbi:uncharacterized protein LOC128190601 isoform X1 [Crassostrea angulata]|uniref:uncharacterized protein LOC128190601 isoform X1 n=1 Tax=Magallana angulata TaxID=2784310 RepID=UPI0022B215FB|nr:uncharacterized protein LOC128190601 isoform X1 [Crassostrea angulata]
MYNPYNDNYGVCPTNKVGMPNGYFEPRPRHAYGNSQSYNGGQFMIIPRRQIYKCQIGHNHFDQEEAEHCNSMTMLTMMASRTNRCHQGHHHANSREVSECNALEMRLQTLRANELNIRLRQTVTDRDGRTIQNEIEYRGNPDWIQRPFGNNPALGQSGGSSMRLSNFPFNY